MSTLSLRLPESLRKQIRELAKKEGISVNQFLATAVAEKMSALMTEEYLEARAKRGSRAGFERAMAKVKNLLPTRTIRFEIGSDPPMPRRKRWKGIATAAVPWGADAAFNHKSLLASRSGSPGKVWTRQVPVRNLE